MLYNHLKNTLDSFFVFFCSLPNSKDLTRFFFFLWHFYFFLVHRFNPSESSESGARSVDKMGSSFHEYTVYCGSSSRRVKIKA